MLQEEWTTLWLRGTEIYYVSLYLMMHLYSVMQQNLKSDSDLIQTLAWIKIWAWHLGFWNRFKKRSKPSNTQFNPLLVYVSHLKSPILVNMHSWNMTMQSSKEMHILFPSSTEMTNHSEGSSSTMLASCRAAAMLKLKKCMPHSHLSNRTLTRLIHIEYLNVTAPQHHYFHNLRSVGVPG